jgi:ABC-type antimicrobial peptide transport system permease subunit
MNWRSICARTGHWQRQGLSLDEARRRASLEFGSAGAVQEQCREARGLRLFDEARSDMRFAVRLMRRTPVLTAVAVSTLALAALGIYGTLAYAVSRRTSEIGVRLALGAERRAIVRIVSADMAVPVAAGMALGLVGAFVSTRALDSLLFGLTGRDAVAMVSATAILGASAAAATWLPARRAARVDPVVALRES